jgi:hypothetical protein
MRKFYDHPDNPDNPQGSTDYDNEILDEEQISEAELWFEIERDEKENEK